MSLNGNVFFLCSFSFLLFLTISYICIYIHAHKHTHTPVEFWSFQWFISLSHSLPISTKTFLPKMHPLNLMSLCETLYSIVIACMKILVSFTGAWTTYQCLHFSMIWHPFHSKNWMSIYKFRVGKGFLHDGMLLVPVLYWSCIGNHNYSFREDVYITCSKDQKI